LHHSWCLLRQCLFFNWSASANQTVDVNMYYSDYLELTSLMSASFSCDPYIYCPTEMPFSQNLFKISMFPSYKCWIRGHWSLVWCITATDLLRIYSIITS